MQLDRHGRVKIAMPPNGIQMYNQFRAHRSSSHTLTDNTWTKISFNSEQYDPDGCHSSGRWTVTESGIAVVCYAVGFQTNLGDQYSGFGQIRRNGSSTDVYARTRLRFSGTNPQSIACTDHISLAAGDYLELWVKLDVTSGSGNVMYSYPEDTYFAGFILATA